jgi:YidC/Oxa1 family membrane protein insertase
MTSLFHIVLVQPLLNALVFLYLWLPGRDMGMAIIALTVIIRIILWPLSHKALHSQRQMQSIQPQLGEIKRKYAQDKAKQAQEMAALYKQYKINPLLGCLPLLVQFPILLALFRVFQLGLQEGVWQQLYSFTPRPEQLDPTLMGIIDLSERSIVLALLAGVLQFIQSFMLMPSKAAQKAQGGSVAAALNKQMLVFFPLLTVFFGLSFPAALPLYWVVTTLFAIFQQYIHDRYVFTKATLA